MIRLHTMVAILSCLCILYTANAQETFRGIRFFDGSFQEAQAISRRDNKMLFVDVYTDWCGPCKQMDKEVLTLPKVGDFYNNNFISIKLNAEKGEGIDKVKQYAVLAYPSYLYFSPAGDLLQKVVGSCTGDAFVDAGKTALAGLKDTSNIAGMKAAFGAGKRDRNFLRSYLELQLSTKTYCDTPVLSAYASQLTDDEMRTPANLRFVVKANAKPAYKSRYYNLVLHNLDTVRLALGTEQYQRFLESFFIQLSNNGFFAGNAHQDSTAFAVFMKDYRLLYSFFEQEDPFKDPRMFEIYFCSNIGDTTGFLAKTRAYISKWLPLLDKLDVNQKSELAGQVYYIGRQYLFLVPAQKGYDELLPAINKMLDATHYPLLYAVKALMLYKTGHKEEAALLMEEGKKWAIAQKYRPNRLKEFELPAQ